MPLIHIDKAKAKDITDAVHPDPLRVYVRDQVNQWLIYRPIAAWNYGSPDGYEVFDLGECTYSSHKTLAAAKVHIRKADTRYPSHRFDFGYEYNLALLPPRQP